MEYTFFIVHNELKSTALIVLTGSIFEISVFCIGLMYFAFILTASDYIEPNSLFDQNDDDVKSEGNHHVEFENKAYLTKLRPTTNNNSNDVNYDQPFHSDEASFLPQSTKQNRTSAKPVVSTTTNNIYEPIFGDYEYPGDIKPDEKTSYTNLGEIDSGTLQYHTLNNSSPSQGNDGEAYIDMNSGEV